MREIETLFPRIFVFKFPKFRLENLDYSEFLKDNNCGILPKHSAPLTEKAIFLERLKAQSRESLITRLRCCRSEVLMKNNLLPLFSLIVILTFLSTAAAQDDFAGERKVLIISSENPVSSANLSRPRRVLDTKESLPRTVNLKNGFTAGDLEEQVFQLLNRQRAAKNLSALEWSDEIAKIARLHSENMAKYKFFSHQGVDGLMVNERADLLGIRKWRAIGENIAFSRGYADPAEFTAEGWMNSVKHRNNILNSRWKESAVGVAFATDGTIYFTQVFMQRQ